MICNNFRLNLLLVVWSFHPLSQEMASVIHQHQTVGQKRNLWLACKPDIDAHSYEPGRLFLFSYKYINFTHHSEVLLLCSRCSMYSSVKHFNKISFNISTNELLQFYNPYNFCSKHITNSSTFFFKLCWFIHSVTQCHFTKFDAFLWAGQKQKITAGA